MRAELLEEIERAASASGGEPDDHLRAFAYRGDGGPEK